MDMRIETLKWLRGARGLWWLDLTQTTIERRDLQFIPRDVEQLGLRGTNVDDASITGIRHLRRLEGLDLADTRVTEKGLHAIASLPKLTIVVIGRHVSQQTVDSLNLRNRQGKPIRVVRQSGP